MRDRVESRGPAAAVCRAGAVCLAATMVLAGCPRENSAPEKPERKSVRLRSFSEPSPVRALIAVAPYVFAASADGLERWDLETGEGLPLSAEHGLPGDRVEAMVYDSARGWMWVATDGGITRYEVASGTFAEIPRAPSVIGLRGFAGASLAPASDGGLWIGHESGLFYTNPEGKWTDTAVSDPVTALMMGKDGSLWIGTETGLVVREPEGITYHYGADQGCTLTSVRFIVEAPGGAPLVVGENEAGKQRIAIVNDERCLTYRASPSRPWLTATRRSDDVLILAGEHLYSLSARERGARSLSRNGLRLLPIKREGEESPPPSPFLIQPVDVRVPAGSRVIASTDGEVLIGTRDLGTARVSPARRRTAWFRRAQLVDGATSLTVACAERDDCYFATGTKTAWRFDGQRFSDTGDGERTALAVVRHPEGRVYMLHRADESNEIRFSKVLAGVWTSVPGLVIETPGTEPDVTFARFSPSGVLWVGLRYRDESGEMRPWGVGLVDVGLGAVVYHHASRDEREREQGVLPIPISVADASFLGEEEVWLATTQGAARIRGEEVALFSEANGLNSEILHGVAATPGGFVFVASGSGVGAFDGRSWEHPPELRYRVNDLEIGADGRLWMATNRGVAMYDGARVRRLDTRRGLLQNEIADIAVDRFGRVWARGSEGITILVP